MELPLRRLSYNFTRTDGGLDLAMKDKGTPHVVASLIAQSVKNLLAM